MGFLVEVGVENDDWVSEKIMSVLVEQGSLEIAGLGRFLVTDYDAYLGRDPRTGEAIQVGARRLPSLKYDRILLESLRGGGALPSVSAPFLAALAPTGSAEQERIARKVETEVHSVLEALREKQDGVTWGALGTFSKRIRFEGRVVATWIPSHTLKVLLSGGPRPQAASSKIIDELLSTYGERRPLTNRGLDEALGRLGFPTAAVAPTTVKEIERICGGSLPTTLEALLKSRELAGPHRAQLPEDLFSEPEQFATISVTQAKWLENRQHDSKGPASHEDEAGSCQRPGTPFAGRLDDPTAWWSFCTQDAPPSDVWVFQREWDQSKRTHQHRLSLRQLLSSWVFVAEIKRVVGEGVLSPLDHERVSATLRDLAGPSQALAMSSELPL